MNSHSCIYTYITIYIPTVLSQLYLTKITHQITFTDRVEIAVVAVAYTNLLAVEEQFYSIHFFFMFVL